MRNPGDTRCGKTIYTKIMLLFDQSMKIKLKYYSDEANRRLTALLHYTSTEDRQHEFDVNLVRTNGNPWQE